jgi:hypothetical protein
MKYNEYNFSAKVWLYPGMAGWHFVSIPVDISGDIKDRFGDRAKGWGSLPVKVSLGKTHWKTSVFPDKKSGGYVLPLKAAVRKKEGIAAKDSVKLCIQILT